MANNESNPGTRERLIEAGGHVFSEVGFRGATIRDICARAGANLAAVNYHFGDKEGLYKAAFEVAVCYSPTGDLAELQAHAGVGPEDQLREFVAQYMDRLLDVRIPAWQPQLIAREMIEPTEVLDQMVERVLRPRYEFLQTLVRPLLGPAGADPELVKASAASVIGQCLLFRHCRPVVERLEPSHGYGPDRTRRRAEHIAKFSIAAMKQLGEDYAAAARKGRE